MRAVIIGTDFIKDTDGSFKAIETNTNVGLGVDTNAYLNLSDFTNFVEINNFNEIVIIHNETNTQLFSNGELEDTNEQYKRNSPFTGFIEEYYSGSSIDVKIEKVNETSVLIPNIEDSDNKLIIRIAYDVTALIDDTYARDNWEFLKLMNDSNPNSIAKTYINDEELGFDSIGSILRDNGNQPNYCIKKRITPANNNLYPKLLKITTIEQLNIIKNGLEADEYLQEYIFNDSDLLNNKLKGYRSVDLVYGSNLDSLNLWIVEQSNLMDIIETPDYNENNEIQIWDRNRYTTKYNSKTNDIAIKLSADESTKILNSENEIIFVQDLNVNDFVKSINFPGIQNDVSLTGMYTWTGSTDLILNESSATSSKVISKMVTPYFGEIIEFELENGSIFSDVPHATILVQSEVSESIVSKFLAYENLTLQTTVFVWDNDTNSMLTSSIVDIKYSYQELNAYTLNVDEFDLFLTLEEGEDNRYGLITHNYNYDCTTFDCSWASMTDNCVDCNSGNWVGSCQGSTYCCRVGGWAPYPPNSVCTFLFTDGWSPFPYCAGTAFYPNPIGNCNGQKPSDTKLKEKIQFIGKSSNGLHIYKFSYNDYIKQLWFNETGESLEGEWRGVMAQELIGTKYEDAVQTHKEGFLIVNYDKLPEWKVRNGYLIK
jgi:hypothetical protein